MDTEHDVSGRCADEADSEPLSVMEKIHYTEWYQELSAAEDFEVRISRSKKKKIRGERR